MELSDKDIDQLYKNNLTDLNLTFDPANWDKLEKKLKKKKRRKFFWLFFLTGIFAASLTLSIYNFNTTKNIGSDIAQTKPKANKKTQKKIIKSAEFKPVKSKEKITELLKFDSTIAIKKNQKSFLKSSKPKTTNFLEKKNLSLINKKRKQHSKTTFSNQSSYKKEELLKSFSKEEKLNNSKKNNKDEKVEIKTEQPKPISYSLDNLNPNFNPILLNTIPSYPRKFGVGIELYPNVNSIFNNPSYLKEQNGIKYYKGSINFGMNFTYFNTEKIDFNVGVNYSKYSHSVWFFKNKTSTEVIVIPSTPTPSDSSILVKENNEFHFVKVQFDFNYYLSRNKWSPYLSVAPALNFNLKSKSEVIYEDMISQNNAESKSLSPSINIGFGLNHSFSKNWNLYLQPNFEFHLIPTTYSTPKELTTPFSMGIKVGLRKNWKGK